jgi:hypothetical protein
MAIGTQTLPGHKCPERKAVRAKRCLYGIPAWEGGSRSSVRRRPNVVTPAVALRNYSVDATARRQDSKDASWALHH